MTTQWSDDIDALRKRLGGLIDRADLGDDTSGLAAEALEELAVVVEEMQAQNSELVTSRADLEAERERYQNLFEAVPDGYVVTDTYGLLQEVNSTAAELFAQSRRRLIGRPLGSLIDEADRRAFYAQLARLRRAGPGGQLSINLRVRDHVTVPANLRAMVAHDPAGTPTSVRWLIHDRRPELTHRDLRISEERLRSLFDTAGVGFLLIDTGGAIVFANRHADEILGRRGEDVDSHAWLGTVHDDDRDRVRNALLDAYGDGESAALRHRIIGSDGRVRWVDHGITPFHSASGVINGSVSTLTDVTTEHDATVDLEVTRDFTEAVLDTVSALVVVTTPFGEIMRFNAACEAAAGRTASEMIGRNLVDTLVPDDERAEVRAALAASSSGEVPVAYDCDWVSTGGGRRRISWTSTLLETPGGYIRAIISTGTDITETQNLRGIAEQTSRLEAVGRLAAGIAHDFNNTLSTLQLRIDRLARLAHSAGESDRDAAHATIARTQHIITDLLSFGGQHQPDPRPIDINAETNRTMSILVDLLGREITVDLQLTADDATATIDPGRFEQALTNLVLNARDAMPAGGTITITTGLVDHAVSAAPPTHSAPRLNPGTYVRLTVSDTGSGIEAHDLAQVFDPYFTTKPPTRGTGLGLATAYGTITQSGGAITVDSKRGEGAEFTLWIPRTPTDTSTPSGESGSGERADSRTPTSSADGLTALVVDDDNEIRELLAGELERLGYETSTAQHGEDALTHIDTPLDLLVTDLQLPGIDGAELADAFSRHQPGIEILFVSGAAPQRIRERVPGDARLLTKPFTSAAFAEALPVAPVTGRATNRD